MLDLLNQLFLTLINTLSGLLFNNLGLAIISITIAFRLALFPILVPSLKSNRRMQLLKPELDRLKKKHGHDKTLLAQKQMDLYKKEGINPAAGCLPQLIQIGLFIAFYHVLINSLRSDQGELTGSLNFLWLSLNQPDSTYVLPVLVGLTQLILGLMILPGADTKAERLLASKTKSKKDDKEAQDATEMAQTMQSQMVYFMPLITFFFALRFPSGLALYWLTNTVFLTIQQYFVSGLGGLKTSLVKLGLKI